MDELNTNRCETVSEKDIKKVSVKYLLTLTIHQPSVLRYDLYVDGRLQDHNTKVTYLFRSKPLNSLSYEYF